MWTNIMQNQVICISFLSTSKIFPGEKLSLHLTMNTIFNATKASDHLETILSKYNQLET